MHKHAISWFISLLTLFFSASLWAQTTAPATVIQQATAGVVADLNQLSMEQRSDQAVRAIVMKWIIPAVDETRVAMGALGKHWRAATPEQRQQFIDRYRELQIQTYSGAFKSFSGEQFSITDTVLNDNGDKAIVKGTIKQKDGSLVPVDFRLYQNNENAPWLVYDAVVAGLSLVKTYRDQLNEQLQKMSMSDLLTELSQKTAH